MNDSAKEARCALASAHAVSFVEQTMSGAKMQRELEERYPVCLEIVACPAVEECGKHSGQLDEIVVHLNDTHRWTRERIAIWVRSIESQVEKRGREAAVKTAEGIVAKKDVQTVADATEFAPANTHVDPRAKV